MAAPVFVLIAGGGTGGHVYPAISLAEALVARGHDPATIRFVGGSRGLEGRAVPDAGFSIDLLPGRGLQRRLAFTNVVTILQTLVALGRALLLVGRYRPRIVVGVGGYASLPCVVAARLWGVPVVVHEQNRAPGLANRLAVRFGGRPATSLPGTPLAGAVVTGNPVRSVFVGVQSAAARAGTHSDAGVLPDKGGTSRRNDGRRLLVVFGGSLGARRLNNAALGLYERWRDRDDVAVYHVCGAREHEACIGQLAVIRRDSDALIYDLVGYEDRMELLYRRASLVACRAGAVTVAELAMTSMPAILVPLPGAPGDHQTQNARALVESGGAVLVPDAELDSQRLDDEATTLLSDPDRLARMAQAAHGLALPQAADHLADLVEGSARA